MQRRISQNTVGVKGDAPLILKCAIEAAGGRFYV